PGEFLLRPARFVGAAYGKSDFLGKPVFPGLTWGYFRHVRADTGAIAVLLLGAPAAPLLSVGQGAGNGILLASTGVLPLAIFGKQGYASRNARILLPARLIQSAGPAIYGFAL